VECAIGEAWNDYRRIVELLSLERVVSNAPQPPPFRKQRDFCHKINFEDKMRLS
jgi:hypothetical protein